MKQKPKITNQRLKIKMKDEKIKSEFSELFCYLPLIFISLIYVFGLLSLIFNL